VRLPLPRDAAFVRLVAQSCETLCPMRRQKELEEEFRKDLKADLEPESHLHSNVQPGVTFSPSYAGTDDTSHRNMSSNLFKAKATGSRSQYSTVKFHSSANTYSRLSVISDVDSESGTKSRVSIVSRDVASSRAHIHRPYTKSSNKLTLAISSYKLSSASLSLSPGLRGDFRTDGSVVSDAARSRLSGTTHRRARALAKAAEDVADDEEELRLMSGGARCRDRLLSLSLLLLSAIVTSTDMKDLENATSSESTSDLIALIEQELKDSNEVWPAFRPDRCNLRVGGLGMDEILSLMKNWILDDKKNQ